jgi:hypothetical protein
MDDHGAMEINGESHLPVWHDPAWREQKDGPWRAGLRLQQAWWRHERLKMPPGPIREGGRLVASMLPLDVGLSPNLLTAEAVNAAERAREELRRSKAPGIIQPDRLRRNLLSSQPLCFNIFGHLSDTPNALLPWVHTLLPEAERVSEIRLEWAPSTDALAGSAFDSFVEVELRGGKRGFLGIECKYAEKLTESQRRPAGAKFVERTRESSWKEGAAEALDIHGLRQLWYNQLLAQAVTHRGDYSIGVGVVMACDVDGAARDAVESVRDQLLDPSTMVFSSLEQLVRSVAGHDEWRARMWERYFDFSPIRDRLRSDDPRRAARRLVG